jgi:uncharacterized Zn finger protein
MPESETRSTPAPAPAVLSNCPQCDAELVVLRIIPGRSSEYWTLRCTRCGGIHLDIVKPRSNVVPLDRALRP